MSRFLPLPALTALPVFFALFAGHAREVTAAEQNGSQPAASAVQETSEAPLPLTWQDAYRRSAKEKTYTHGPNVHRSTLYCVNCHGPGIAAAGNLLYGGRDIAVCRSCHPRSVYRLHVVGIKPKKVEVPAEFPLPNGQITCWTCHKEPSCYPNDEQIRKRPFFLRGDKSGFQFCFSCHGAKNYTPYNPHDPKHLQSAEERRNNCVFCHTAELPVESHRGLDFAALKGAPNDLCSACHLPEPHYGVRAHLEVKDAEVLARVAEAASREGWRMPLGQDKAPLCVSCHDPHMPGLIRQEQGQADPWMEGPGSPLRQAYLTGTLYPYLNERVTRLESEYGRALIIREPGLFHPEGRKLLRKGFNQNRSLCLLCHDVSQEKAGIDEKGRFGFRMLH